jgi:hypothetical protein
MNILFLYYYPLDMECPNCLTLIPKVKRKYKKRKPKVKPEAVPLEILKEDIIISFE